MAEWCSAVFSVSSSLDESSTYVGPAILRAWRVDNLTSLARGLGLWGTANADEGVNFKAVKRTCPPKYTFA